MCDRALILNDPTLILYWLFSASYRSENGAAGFDLGVGAGGTT